MQIVLGLVLMFVCVFGGYAGMGGKLGVLWQPLEFVIIGGASIGAYIMANPSFILKGAMGYMKTLMKGTPYKKEDYIDMLGFMFIAFKTIKSKGLMSIEADIENPHDSELFNKFPKFAHDHHSVEFFCDYMRLITMGVDNHYQMDDLMTSELDSHHHDAEAITGSITTMGDGYPAVGIVAAVLGVIKTMGSINSPPEVLGKMIAGALVGTFFGIWMGYTIVGPIAQYLGKYTESEGKMLECIKAAILANMQGNAPAVTIEFVRKSVPHSFRPSFIELEEALNAIES